MSKRKPVTDAGAPDPGAPAVRSLARPRRPRRQWTPTTPAPAPLEEGPTPDDVGDDR